MPSPISILFYQSVVIPELTAFIDSGERLKIYLSMRGRNTFNIKKNSYTDFSGVIIFFGTLISLSFGFNGFNDKEYLQFLASCSKRKTLYFSILAARLVKMTLFFLFVLACALVLIFINGVIIPYNWYLLLFFAMIILHMLFFFLLGSCFLAVKSKITGVFILLACWYFFLFFTPGQIQSFTSSKASDIQPIYELELKKLNILYEFEKRADKNNVTYRPGEKLTEAAKKMVLSYLNDEFNKIQTQEKIMQGQMRCNILRFQKMSLFLPTTFYLSTTNEISSMGFVNLMDFYRFVFDRKEEFVKFIMDKIYFENFSKVVPFQEGKGNVFHSGSRLPGYFSRGLAINLIYIPILLLISYAMYRVFVTGRHSSLKKIKKPVKVIHLNPGTFKEWVVYGTNFKDRLYTALSGEVKKIKKKGYQSKIHIKGIDLSTVKGEIDFLCLCHPDHIPSNIRVDDLIDLMSLQVKDAGDEKHKLIDLFNLGPVMKKKINKISNHQKGDLLLAILYLKKKQVYILDDIARGMPVEFHIKLKDRIDELTKNGAIVLFLISNHLITDNSLQSENEFLDVNTWSTLVERFKIHKKKTKEK